MNKHRRISSFLPFLIYFALLGGTNVSFGQNIVPNHSFNVQDTCPAVSELFLAPPWDSPTLGSPDLFNSTCSSQNSPGRTGIGSSGVFCYSTFPNSREYIQAPLDSTLIAGQTYCVSFYVRRSNFRYAISNIGAYFSPVEINENITNPLNYTPQVENDPNNVIISTSSWTEIKGSFVATGGENYIIIGNFYGDANTDTVTVNSSSSSAVAYYKIDDVSLTSCPPTSTTDLEKAERSISVYPVPASHFINLKLDSDINVSNSMIIDLQGRKIMDIPFEMSAAGIYPVDISSIPTGIYFVSIQTSYGVLNKRIMIFN